MCLGVPGRVLRLLQPLDPLLRMGVVAFGGIEKEVCLAYVSEAVVGDYVLVHAGFAISCMDEAAAAETLDLLGIPRP